VPPKTNDAGGPRHIAMAVKDAGKMFEFLKSQKGVTMINTSSEYGPPQELTPFPISFFYWIDPWGVQWEMEQGRPIGKINGIIG